MISATALVLAAKRSNGKSFTIHHTRLGCFTTELHSLWTGKHGCGCLEMHYSCTYFVLSMNNPEQYVGIFSICVTQNAINIWHLNWHVGFEKLKTELRQQGKCKQFHLSRLTELCSQCFDFFQARQKNCQCLNMFCKEGKNVFDWNSTLNILQTWQIRLGPTYTLVTMFHLLCTTLHFIQVFIWLVSLCLIFITFYCISSSISGAGYTAYTLLFQSDLFGKM